MRKKFLLFLLAISILLIGGGIIYFNPWHTKQVTAVTYSPTAYSAVFLTNGQVYFGHITSITTDLLTLTDVFYLSTTANTNVSNPASSSLQFTLIKLGTEIHAPKDTMSINRTNVEFWEELQETSDIVKAIRNYKPK